MSAFFDVVVVLSKQYVTIDMNCTSNQAKCDKYTMNIMNALLAHCKSHVFFRFAGLAK